ncbi:ARM repeat-containing protein [Neocallimastix lanati (nom. inval.)]|nr:ARM repeat-containing protein [Neocallimastix sp. JGI-2020a]
MPLKNKSYLEPIQRPNTKKKELPTCFTNRLNEFNAIRAFPQYIPNTRTPALRPMPKINPRYLARLNDTQDFEQEIQDSEITKELEKEIDEEKNILKLKFDSEVVTERSTIPFGIMPKSKLLSPVIKRNNSGIFNSFLSESSLCKNGNLNIIENTYNFGITPDIFEYLKKHSKNITKNDYFHYLSESQNLRNLKANYQFPINMTSLYTQNFNSLCANINRPILQPIKIISKSTLNNNKDNSHDSNNNDDEINVNNTVQSIINENYDDNYKNDKNNRNYIDNNNLNNSIQSTELNESLNNTIKNKEILKSYIKYIQNTSKELIDIHRLTHFQGINDSEAYKKTENVISNSTYKYICNAVQNKNGDNNINNKSITLKNHKKKGAFKSLTCSESINSEIENNYWVSSIMNGISDEQLIQNLTHTERVDSKTPIYRQRYPANIQQMHINVKKKTLEEKKRKYEKLINDIDNNTLSRSNNTLLNDYLYSPINNHNSINNNDDDNSINNNLPKNNTISKENLSKKNLFRIKHSYLTISLVHFSSLLKSDPINQLTTYNFEKNDFIKEKDIIPLNSFLKTPLSNYHGPIPKRGTQMFYHMYSIFIQGLKSQNKNVRFESMNGIAKLDCIEMIPQTEKIWFNSLLNQVIVEGSSDYKWTICTMLSRHGIQTHQVIEYLICNLGDTDKGKRKYVVYLLSRISDKNINYLVKSIINDKIKDANWKVRLDCIKILRKLLKRMLKYLPENTLYFINNESMCESKKKCDKFGKGNEICIKDKDVSIVNQALQIIMNIMWYDWKLDVRNAASRLLMKIGKGKPIYSWIKQMISSDNPMKKINGLKCIGCLNIMTNDAIETFLKCFDDMFSTVRITACKVAYILKLDYPPLIQKLANCFDDNSWEVRAFAIKAMSQSKCRSDLVINTILWNLVHETDHRVLFETIKAVRKLNLIKENKKIKDALLLLLEDKNKNITELVKQILYDNEILFDKNRDNDFTSPKKIIKEKPQKEINILYNTRPPFNFACDGLDIIKHEVNLLTMKDYITSEIIEQEKKYKNYSRIDDLIKYSHEKITKKPSIPIKYNNNNNKSNSSVNQNKVPHHKIRIIDDMTFKYVEYDD